MSSAPAAAAPANPNPASQAVLDAHAAAAASAAAPFVRVPRDQLPRVENDLLLRAGRGERTPRAPAWIMRQAGRYLPEYMEMRVMADFFKVCRTPELACRVTLQPLERFATLDALIIFSDILVIPQAMGMEVQMVKGRGPVFPAPLREPSQLAQLDLTPDVGASLGYVFDAINLVRQRSAGRVPVIGFCGAPWTLMAYMVEGGGTKTFHNSVPWLYNHPQESHTLLGAIADLCVTYLLGQVRAGANMLQVFDSWGGQLGPALFAEFSLPYLCRIATGVKDGLAADPTLPSPNDVPMTVFAKGAHWALADLARSDYDVLQLDWTMDPRAARRVVQQVYDEETAAAAAAAAAAAEPAGSVQQGGGGGGGGDEGQSKRARRWRRQAPKSLQGNLNPACMYADEPVLRGNVRAMVEAFCEDGKVEGYIANLGWGMQPYMSPESAGNFIDEAQKASLAVAGR